MPRTKSQKLIIRNRGTNVGYVETLNALIMQTNTEAYKTMHEWVR